MKKLYLLILLAFSLGILSAQIIDTTFYSPALAANRNVDVYLPPGYDANPDLHYPVIYFFHGWGGSENSAVTIMNEAEILINAGTIDPLIIICPNNSPNPFKGSFYVNSTTSGNFGDFNIIDLITWIDSTYRTQPEKKFRTIMGQSMGGYGAFRYAVLHDTLFRAIASHAAAINFDIAIDDVRTKILLEHPGGAPYF